MAAAAATEAVKRTALVVGGGGALGRAVLSSFSKSTKKGACIWHTTSLDLSETDEASYNITLDPAQAWSEQLDTVTAKIKESGLSFDSVVHVAGGFQAGDILSGGVEPVELMWQQNVKSAYMAAHIAANHANKESLLVLTGADAVIRGGTSFAVGYGMAKAATHHLAKSISESSELLPEGSRTVCILPTTIDTVANRAAMADGDFASWIPPQAIGQHIVDWSENHNNIPESLFVRIFASEVDDGPYLASDHIAGLNVSSAEDDE